MYATAQKNDVGWYLFALVCLPCFIGGAMGPLQKLEHLGCQLC